MGQSDRSASLKIIPDVLSLDPAVAHHERPAGARRDRLVVRDDDHGRAVVLDAIEQLGNLLAGRAIQLAGRLVGQQKHGPVGERAGDRDPLHFAAGELRRKMVRAMREADVLQQLGRASTASPRVDSGFGLRQLDVLPGREHGQQKESLKHKANLRQPHVAAIRIRQRARHPGPSKSSVPLVGVSTHPRMCSSVDFPQPDGPQMATYSAGSIRSETPCTAVTGPAAIGNTLGDVAGFDDQARHDHLALSVDAIGKARDRPHRIDRPRPPS